METVKLSQEPGKVTGVTPSLGTLWDAEDATLSVAAGLPATASPVPSTASASRPPSPTR